MGVIMRKLKKEAGSYHGGLPKTRNYSVSENLLVSEFQGTLVLGNIGDQVATNRMDMEG